MTSARTFRLTLAVLVSLICLAQQMALKVSAQAGVDRELLGDIMKIKAIDNHAHPVKYVAPGEAADTEFDALPLDAIAAFPLPLRLSPTNPEFVRAWKDL